MRKIVFFVVIFCSYFINAQEKINVLEEVVVSKQLLPKHNSKKYFKGKKYFTEFHKNFRIASVHKNKKAIDFVGFKLEIDASALNSEDSVAFRPIVLFEDLSEVRSFKNEFRLDEDTKEVIFSFSENPIRLEENKIYFFGIEIVDKNQTNKHIKIKALNKKGFYSVQKLLPNKNWFRLENPPYTLDYELFFKE